MDGQWQHGGETGSSEPADGNVTHTQGPPRRIAAREAPPATRYLPSLPAPDVDNSERQLAAGASAPWLLPAPPPLDVALPCDPFEMPILYPMPQPSAPTNVHSAGHNQHTQGPPRKIAAREAPPATRYLPVLPAPAVDNSEVLEGQGRERQP